MRVLRALLSIVPLGACLEPTEMRVVLTSDACARIRTSDAVTIRVTTRGQIDSDIPVSAATNACKDGRIGDIVLVPSNRGEEVGIRVVADIDDPSPCTQADGYKGCIVARRIIKFVSHTPLTLPIALDANCVDVACDENTTCVNGACVSAEITNPRLCAGDAGCALAGDGGSDAGIDGDAGMKPIVLDWVSAGSNSTCARKTNGDVYCWGYNNTGTLGLQPGTNPLPLLVTSLKGAQQIGLGANHGCAIDPMGVVVCWGNPLKGVLGDGQFGTAHEPAPVFGSLTALQISTGFDFNCALQAKVVACWGDNTTDQVGISPGLMAYATPQMTSTIGATAISAGYSHACFIANQNVQCWGENKPAQPKCGTGPNPTPSPMTTSATGVQLVAAGSTHTCAAGKGSSNVLCWGDNTATQLGSPGAASATPKTFALNAGISVLAAGENFTCALIGNGELWCWGGNDSGQLGLGAPDALGHVPTKMMLPPVDGVSAGTLHVCAWTKTGSVWCWGNSSAGQVGNGSTMAVYAPAAVTIP